MNSTIASFRKEIMKDLTINMLSSYNKTIYNVDYINLILSEFDKEISDFSFTKKYTLYDPTYQYIVVINDSLVIRVDIKDVYHFLSIYLKNGKILHNTELYEEAREKIAAKYNQCISRLEDMFKLPYNEILTTDIN